MRRHIKLSTTNKTLCGIDFKETEYGLDVCSECEYISNRLLMPFTNKNELLKYLKDRIHEENLISSKSS